MKKLVTLLMVALFMFCVTAQAMAYFEDGNLIRVIYSKTDGTGTEFATDLGSISNLTTMLQGDTNFLANNFSLSSVNASSWSDVYVAYYALTLTPAAHAWTSGPMDAQSSASRQWSAYLGAAHSANAVYALSGSATATGLQSDPNSYWNQLNVGTQAGQGMFKGLIPAGNGETNLADLATLGYVDQMLYYYASPNSANAGLQVAQIRTFADGHTALLGETTPAVPIPPSILLLGTGLLGLVGIRRKNAA